MKNSRYNFLYCANASRQVGGTHEVRTTDNIIIYPSSKVLSSVYCRSHVFHSQNTHIILSPVSLNSKTRRVHLQSLLIGLKLAVKSLIKPVRNFHEKGRPITKDSPCRCLTVCNLGIPMISAAQQSKTSRFFDVTAIATFLSGVTASMIQATVTDDSTATGAAANTFFFSSLVFSIGSAVNSLLVISWRRSVVFVSISLGV